jgi:Domain of unknown function (DUF4342)
MCCEEYEIPPRQKSLPALNAGGRKIQTYSKKEEKKEKHMSQTDHTNSNEQKPDYKSYTEELQVVGEQLLAKVKELLHEGNVRRIIIKQEGHSIMEFPLTFGVVGVVVAPVLAAIGAIGALIAQCSIEVVRVERPGSSEDVPPSAL